ncbi:PilN domain-containing protein [bacterium]|nr:PilN domain-containing protein [bacterium]
MKERRFVLINLVAERKRRERLIEKRGRQMIWACVFLFAVIIFYLFYTSIRIYTLQGDLREIQTKIEGFTPLLRHAEELQREIDSLNPRIQFIQGLRQGIFYLQGISLEIQRLLPSDCWLDSLSFSPLQTSAIQIQVNGKALSYSSVGNFILRLQSTNRYQNTNLKSANLTKIGERNVVQYQIELQAPLQGGGTK